MMPPSGVRGVRCSSRRRAGDTPASSSSVGSESRSSVESAAEAKPPSKKRQQSSDIMQLPLREGLPWTCKCGEVLAARKLRSYICLLLRIFSSLRIHIEFLDLFVVRRRKRTIPLWEVQKVRACVGRWPHFADESNVPQMEGWDSGQEAEKLHRRGSQPSTSSGCWRRRQFDRPLGRGPLQEIEDVQRRAGGGARAREPRQSAPRRRRGGDQIGVRGGYR
ncbi:hypothetical protein THAOC_14663 [Thalassiosira oceanica]|uniref:Uncharacterized protein n=1 Tax=Thalassiosira oceanica TaxID=159749 RepID=K0SHY8_THAOC|nr:hypothetical protein THAOC_14663 [Thalassiosira oceanica]|eukprot:EJK64589.1 hypothetical protein THAOC_14663 [Thalassiosira oceanica]